MPRKCCGRTSLRAISIALSRTTPRVTENSVVDSDRTRFLPPPTRADRNGLRGGRARGHPLRRAALPARARGRRDHGVLRAVAALRSRALRLVPAGPHVAPTSIEGYVLQRSGLFLAILPTWANDVAAYGVGAAFGRRKLLPHVSPGKTVEGTLGGLVASIVVAVALVSLLDFPTWVGAGVGLIVGIVGPLGDLVECAIKRAAAAKDLGGLLPGHGGD